MLYNPCKIGSNPSISKGDVHAQLGSDWKSVNLYAPIHFEAGEIK